MKKEPDIAVYRHKIDALDKKIAKLLAERFETSRKIGVYKKNNNLPIADAEREKAIVADVKKSAGAYGENVADVYRTILFDSRKIQEDLS